MSLSMVLAFMAETFFIFCFFSAGYLVLLGWGLATWRLFVWLTTVSSLRPPLTFATAPFVGLFALSMFLQFTYFFVPLDEVLWAPVVLVGSIGLLTNRPWHFGTLWAGRLLTKRGIFSSCVAVTAALWMSVLVRVELKHPDFFGIKDSAFEKFGYSHAMQLIREMPATFGAGNLSPRAAFWSSSWVISGWVDSLPATLGGSGAGHVWLNSVFGFCLILSAYILVLQIRKNVPEERVTTFGWVGISTVYLGRISINTDWWLVAPVPEVPGMALILLSSLFLWILLATRNLAYGIISLVFALTACQFRFTYIPWLIMVLIVLILVTARSGVSNSSRKWRLGLVCFSLSAIGLGVGAVMRFILSGFPFYPLRVFGFSNLPWMIPEQAGDNLRWFFSRNLEIPAEYLEGGRWILPFARYLLLSDTAVQMSVLMFLVSLLWLLAKESVDKWAIKPYFLGLLWVFLFALLSIVIWGSFTVVERYAWPYFLMPGLLTLVLFVAFVRISIKRLAVLSVVGAVGCAVVITMTPHLRSVLPGLGKSEPIRVWDVSYGEKNSSNPFGISSLPNFDYKQLELRSGDNVDSPLEGASCGLGRVLCVYDQDITVLTSGRFGPGNVFTYFSVTG